MKFTVNKKTGFSTDGKIVIKDRNYVVFYVFPLFKAISFNLPKGTYFLTAGSLKRLKKPITYTRPKQGVKEKNRALPKKIKLTYSPDASKATIKMTKNIYYVNLDISLKKAPRFLKAFIKLHELGHHVYKSEKKADTFAAVAMLNYGYNPTQIYCAAKLLLNHDVSRDRITNIYNFINKRSTFKNG
jgi:hypothetical protein